MSAPRVDFASIRSASLASVDVVLSRWLPGGKQQGHEYLALNPTRADSKPGSFSVNLRTGAWADFAAGEKGGDLIALVAMLEGVKQGAAAKALQAFLYGGESSSLNRPVSGFSGPGKAKVSPAPENSLQADSDGVGWAGLVPDDAPPIPSGHPKHGAASAAWDYRHPGGALAFRVFRFDPVGERKQFAPLTLWEEGGRMAWKWKAPPAPRLLYGADRVALRPDAPVVVCEGEKAADAAGRLLPGMVAVASYGGAASAGRSDWSSLSGRRVIIWPDHDAPGAAFAEAVATLATTAGAASVDVVDVPATFGESVGTAPGWDAADAEAGGLDASTLPALRFSGAARTMEPEAGSGPETGADGKARKARRFSVSDAGVLYQADARPGEEPPPALWLCSRVDVAARTRDRDSDAWGRLLEWNDPDGVRHSWAMPMALLQGDGQEVRRMLASGGVAVAPSRAARDALSVYLQSWPPAVSARCVDACGWHGGAFVLPDQVIGATGDERVVLQSDTRRTRSTAGTAATWRDEVGRRCSGNSRLVMAASIALAGPLMRFAGAHEGGGFHLRGESSSGKSTALRVAASVWGSPADVCHKWRATGNGLEGMAAESSDGLLILDEIGQADADEVGETVYMLANGSGKLRARRDGSAKPARRWRLLFLSAGEVGLSDRVMERGRGGKVRAGQEVRMVDIPADAGAGMGAFESLHDAPTPAAFSGLLSDATAAHHGAVIVAWLEAIAGMDAETLRAAMTDAIGRFLSGLPAGMEGQATRAAQRFALVAFAGEAATARGLTGWQAGEATTAARACLTAWIEARGGAGNQERDRAIETLRDFLDRHGDSRFSPADDGGGENRAVRDRAGWWKDDGGRVFLLTPAGLKEALAGHDFRRALAWLSGCGALPASGANGRRQSFRIGGRVVKAYPVLYEKLVAQVAHVAQAG